MRETGKQGIRKRRFFLDMLISLVLLLAVLAAASSRTRREETRFRRAEKADLAGPSEILDRMDVPEDWPDLGYSRLLMGDDGEEILFYLSREDGAELLLRREKTDGLLLTPAPYWNPVRRVQWTKGEAVVPLFLYADDPARTPTPEGVRCAAAARTGSEKACIPDHKAGAGRSPRRDRAARRTVRKRLENSCKGGTLT